MVHVCNHDITIYDIKTEGWEDILRVYKPLVFISLG